MPRILALLLVTALACALAMPAAGGREARAEPATEYTGDVIVRFRDGVTLAQVGDALGAAGVQATASSAPSKLVLLEPEAGQTVDGAVDALNGRGDVEFAEADTVMRTTLTPNDTWYGSQWALPQIGAPSAWNTTTGSASVIVAVIDTGVDTAHADLDSKITSGANAGYDFHNGDSNPVDDNGHGTFVAGIIAAESNNASNVAGVCWACKIMPVKVLAASGSGSTFNVAAGIDWARTHGAQVINLSLGGGASSTLQTAVDNAWNAGIIVVAASGNYADDADATNDWVLYPAAYPNALAIGANDSAGVRSTFSNYGPEMDLMAPGENVLSTIMGGGVGSGSGTSFATPHVAGVVGLMVSAGITDKNTIRTKLTTTATDMGAAGFDSYNGHGRVNANGAVTTVPQYAVTWGSNTLPSALQAGATANVSVSFTNAGSLTWASGGVNPVKFSYHWLNGACAGTTTYIYEGQRTSLSADVAQGGVASLTATVRAPALPGTYCLQYDLVREGVSWFSAQGAAMQTGTATVSANSQYGVSWGSAPMSSTVVASTWFTPAVSFTNTGSLTWTAAGPTPVRLAYHWASGSCPSTSTVVWDGIRSPLSADVPSGGTVAALTTYVQAPAAPGTYCLQYDLVHEFVSWFSSVGAGMKTRTITVTAPQYYVTWTSDDTPGAMTAGQAHGVTLSFTNSGTLTWPSTGANRVRLAYHWYDGACPGTTLEAYDGVRTELPGDVAASGAVAGLGVTVIAPVTAGTYCLVYDVVREGVTWFSWQNAPVLTRTVTVS